MRPQILALAVCLLVATGCGDDTPRADDLPRSVEPDLVVEPTRGARLSASAPILPVLSLGGSLVAVAAEATTPQRSRPLVTSTDGGRTWVHTQVPAGDQGDLSTWELIAVDGLGVLAGGEVGPDRFQGPPVLWTSDDDGATFRAADGIAEGVDQGDVRAVVAVDDVLLALGAIIPDGGFQSIPVTWTSTDRGRTWTRLEHPQLGPSDTFATSVAASDDRVLATTAAGVVASDDGGRTWTDADLPLLPSTGQLEADGEVITVTSTFLEGDTEVFAAAVSTDGGTSWIRADPLPAVADRDGTGTTLSQPRSVRATSDGALVAVAGTVENNDRYLPYLVRSEDGGRTWSLADMPRLECPSSAHIGPPAVVEGLAVAVFDCGGPLATDLLTSVDGGRTWQRRSDAALGTRLLGLPFPSGGREVTLLAGRGAVVHLSVPG